MIDVHLLRYALAAADTGSFSRAAGQFGIKQSTLSKRIYYLEARLGLPLFRRSTRGVVPTLPGDHILRQARRILQDIDALADTSGALAKGEQGVLRLGFCGSLATGDLSAVLSSYRQSFPGVEIEAREGGRAALLDTLEREDLDVAVLSGLVNRTGIQSLSYWKEPLTIALPVSAPETQRSPLYWTDLRGYGFMVTSADPGPDIAAMIVARLAAPGQTPSIIAQKVSRENLVQLGTTSHLPVLAGAAHEPLPVSGALSYHEIHDAFGPTMLDQGVHWRTANANPALKRFLQHLSQRYARPLLA